MDIRWVLGRVVIGWSPIHGVEEQIHKSKKSKIGLWVTIFVFLDDDDDDGSVLFLTIQKANGNTHL